MGVQGLDRKRLAIIGGVGVVVVGALAVFALTSGGGGGGAASPTSSTRASASAATAPRRVPSASTTTTTAVATMPDSFQTFTERNPFQPSVNVGSDGTTSTTTGTGAAGTTPSTTATTAGSGAPSGNTVGAGSVASPAAGAGTAVQLLSVSSAGGAPTASVQVGPTVYTVTPGQTFATSYKLVSLSGSCGKFLFGDSPFSLCTGEQVLK